MGLPEVEKKPYTYCETSKSIYNESAEGGPNPGEWICLWVKFVAHEVAFCCPFSLFGGGISAVLHCWTALRGVVFFLRGTEGFLFKDVYVTDYLFFQLLRQDVIEMYIMCIHVHLNTKLFLFSKRPFIDMHFPLLVGHGVPSNI